LLLALGLGSWVRWRRKGRRRADAARSEHGRSRRPSFPSPEDRRIHRAELLRDALITAFGPSWNAKTTEEIAADPALRARLGPEPSGRVVAILAEADRAKFAASSAEPPRAGEEEHDDDDRSLADLIASLASPPAGTAR
jgi:hypothetical protein